MGRIYDVDLNDFKDNGITIFDISSASAVSNAPEGFYYGCFICATASNQTIQIGADTNGKIYIRSADGGAFTVWKTL